MEICDYPLIKVFEEMLSPGRKRASKMTSSFLWNTRDKVGLDRGKDRGRKGGT